MAIGIALLALFFLLLTVGGLYYLNSESRKFTFIVILYTYKLISESAMLTTSLLGLKNHVIANIHFLVFGIGMLIIISEIWKRLLRAKFPKPLLIILVFSYLIIWALDAFLIHGFETFNPFSQTLIFLINLILVLYLLNVLLFMPRVKLGYRADRLIILSFLVHCFGAVMIDSFFNYYVQLPDGLYLLVSYLGLFIGLAANFLILLAVLCLIQNKKSFLL